MERLSEIGRSGEDSYARVLAELRKKVSKIGKEMDIIRAENKELQKFIKKELRQCEVA